MAGRRGRVGRRIPTFKTSQTISVAPRKPSKQETEMAEIIDEASAFGTAVKLATDGL